jgi:hypothetical protein
VNGTRSVVDVADPRPRSAVGQRKVKRKVSRRRLVGAFVALLVSPLLLSRGWTMPEPAGAATTANPMPLQEFVNDGANGRLWNAYNRTDDSLGPTISGRPSPVTFGSFQDVFARSATGDLVQYVDDNLNGRTWNAYDLTQASNGGQIVGDPAAVVVGGSAIYVLARLASGDLASFTNDGAGGHLWAETDVTTSSGGGAIQADPAVVTSGSVLDVFAEGANGDLVEFSGSGSGGRTWAATDLTKASGGPVLSGAPGAVLFGQTTLHVYGVSTTRHLTEFVDDGSGQRPWSAYDVTTIATGPSAAGQPSAIVYGPTVHVYVDAAGHLNEFVNDGFAGRLWNSYDISAISKSPSISGDPSAVFYNSTTVDVFSQGTNDDLVSYVNDGHGGRLWNSYDLSSASSGPSLGGDPAALAAGGSVSVFAAGPLPPAVIQSIVAAAEGQDQYNLAVVENPPGSNCNIYTAYWGRGSTAGCAPGNSAEEWCSDFAEWAWAAGGIDTSGINGWAFSFVDWGEAHAGAWQPGTDNSPAPGDAVVWGDTTSGYAAHVAIVVGVSGGQIDVVSGNSGPPIDAAGDVDAVWESGYFDPTTSTVAGYPIIGYVAPTGWTGYSAVPFGAALSSSDLAALIATQDAGK